MDGEKQDSAKKQTAEELLNYSNTFLKVVFGAFASKGDIETEIGKYKNRMPHWIFYPVKKCFHATLKVCNRFHFGSRRKCPFKV